MWSGEIAFFSDTLRQFQDGQTGWKDQFWVGPLSHIHPVRLNLVMILTVLLCFLLYSSSIISLTCLWMLSFIYLYFKTRFSYPIRELLYHSLWYRDLFLPSCLI
jgi:hypothetical protein